ncbi:MAG: tetratricopeptide repeat protein [Tannerellaceae bacterium]|jgi:tetratricopeptide (TPR) repeat protein|nr:tetratricopeptide repeat protein [Tannerellaceae bacterium]
MKGLLYLPVIGLLTACSAVRYIEISACNPSEVTYPPNVRKVLIVNNALPQSPDSGYEFNLMGAVQDTCRANADSALFDACRALGAAIVESEFFDDVLLFQEATRRDDASYADVQLSSEDVGALCAETGADAVISFDRLLFDMKKEIRAFPEGYLAGSIRIDVKGMVRSYLPGRKNPLLTAFVSDSLWIEDVFSYSLEDLSLSLPAPDDALRIAGNFVGSKISPLFVPHWTNEVRWFFTNNGARWKEATAYAASGKWEKAAERWQYIHDKATRWSDKARSASNLALACEITGQMHKALEWAELAFDLFEKNKGDDARTREQQLYIEALKQRIANDGKLNLQFGTE